MLRQDGEEEDEKRSAKEDEEEIGQRRKCRYRNGERRCGGRGSKKGDRIGGSLALRHQRQGKKKGL